MQENKHGCDVRNQSDEKDRNGEQKHGVSSGQRTERFSPHKEPLLCAIILHASDSIIDLPRDGLHGRGRPQEPPQRVRLLRRTHGDVLRR